MKKMDSSLYAEMDKAYRLGIKARRDGKDRDKNPYPTPWKRLLKTCHGEWDRGWLIQEGRILCLIEQMKEKSPDTIRMNWLSTVSCEIYSVRIPTGDITVLDWDNDEHTGSTVRSATLRAAIDAAMLYDLGNKKEAKK